MLTRGLYIEALLVDAEAADAVWEAWDKGVVDDQMACFYWLMLIYEISALRS